MTFRELTMLPFNHMAWLAQQDVEGCVCMCFLCVFFFNLPAPTCILSFQKLPWKRLPTGFGNMMKLHRHRWLIFFTSILEYFFHVILCLMHWKVLEAIFHIRILSYIIFQRMQFDTFLCYAIIVNLIWKDLEFYG